MKIYLAIPYSYNPEKSFSIANEVAAKLMLKGNIVFSPISHSHHIADHLPANIRTDSEWWMHHDLPMIDWANKLVVIVIGEYGHELIEQSKGVQAELEYARLLGKPIEIYDYYKNNDKG